MEPDYRALLGGVLEHLSASVRVPTAEAPLGTPASLQADPAEPEPDVAEPDADVDDTTNPDEPAPAGSDFGSFDSRERRPSSHAWGGHENGRIPDDALKEVGGGQRLESHAADAWTSMVAAAKADGVSLTLTDSYRSYDEQVRVRQEKGGQVATATPGTSVHGWGQAVDANVNDSKALQWLRANAGRFGWVNPAWAQREGKSFEPWHWEFMGGGNG